MSRRRGSAGGLDGAEVADHLATAPTEKPSWRSQDAASRGAKSRSSVIALPGKTSSPRRRRAAQTDGGNARSVHQLDLFVERQLRYQHCRTPVGLIALRFPVDGRL